MNVLKMIEAWKNKLDDESFVKTVFKNKSCLLVSRDMYEQMKTKMPEKVHFYFGVDKNEVYMILIDSESVNANTWDGNYFICELLDDVPPGLEEFTDHAVDGNVSVIEALRRNVKWGLNKINYITEASIGAGIVRYFRMPFSNLINQFTNSDNQQSIVTFGMRNRSGILQPELLTWSTAGLETEPGGLKCSIGGPVFNDTFPCPPHCE